MVLSAAHFRDKNMQTNKGSISFWPKLSMTSTSMGTRTEHNKLILKLHCYFIEQEKKKKSSIPERLFSSFKYYLIRVFLKHNRVFITLGKYLPIGWTSYVYWNSVFVTQKLLQTSTEGFYFCSSPVLSPPCRASMMCP